MAWPPWRGHRSEPPATNEAKDQLLSMADRLMEMSHEARGLSRRLEKLLTEEEEAAEHG